MTMRHRLILAALACIAAVGIAPWIVHSAAPSEFGDRAAPPGYDLELAFDDDFDGAALNGRHWGTIFADPRSGDRTVAKRTLWGNGERQVYFDPQYLGLGIEPHRVQGGLLTITAQPMSAHARAEVQADVATQDPKIANVPVLKTLEYQSGMITQLGYFAQQYGYFEVRARWSGGKGIWPAIWLLPARGGWPPEIDIVESLGHEQGIAYHSIHSRREPRNTTIRDNFGGDTAQFHRYGALWLPDRVDYYIDGAKVATIPANGDMNQPMYLLLNLAIGGNWPGLPDATTAFPATMDVDYVRIWKFRALPGQN